LTLLGIGVGVVFVRRQLSLTAPMLPVDLFRLPIFALSVVTSVCSYACQTLAYLALPFYFQYAGGQSQIETGLLMTPWPAVVILIAPIAGHLSDRYPAGLLGGCGLAVLSVGMLLLTGVSADAHWTDVAWRMLVCGIGFGFFQSPNNRALIASAPRDRSGAGSGMLSTARLTGQTIGGLIAALMLSLSGGGVEGVALGAQLSLIVGAGFAGMAMVMSFLRLRSVQPA
jgi:DHA2 family multidrug resistance protein-like MFS transporter